VKDYATVMGLLFLALVALIAASWVQDLWVRRRKNALWTRIRSWH
jgi:hypothetical protein